MSDGSEFIAESLEELLASIAQGIHDAQDALNAMPTVDGFGRNLPTYHLPYLDFNVQVEMESVSASTGSNFLRISPVNSNQTSTKEISSTISGRIVSIPPGEGLPTPLLSLASEKISPRKYKIMLNAINTAGEALIGQRVELNINLPASVLLSESMGITLTSKGANTALKDALLVTDELGNAGTEFTIDSEVDVKAQLVLTAELQGQTAHLNISVDINV
ncbi:MAG: hypothetical protein COB04_05125 [Gammaproteobacteria bacterium]|nr:MAG: hypothetical protein COB04_05125 [Gammaproteobacteria bacterium]